MLCKQFTARYQALAPKAVGEGREEPGRAHAVRPYHKWTYRDKNTGQGALRRTYSVVLPRTISMMRLWP